MVCMMAMLLEVPVDMNDVAFVSQRPFLKDLLTYAADHFEVVLWTAGAKKEAEWVLEKVYKAVGRRDVFDHVVTRDPSWFEMPGYRKRLEQLGRPLTHVVMLENAPVVVPMSNCIMVNDYVASEIPSVSVDDDVTLLNMKTLLERWDASMEDAAEFVEREKTLGNLTGPLAILSSDPIPWSNRSV